VRRAFEADAVFARRMGLAMANAYCTVVKELKNQKLRFSLERLTNWILSQAGPDNRFELPFDKKLLASRLGMAPEVLSPSFAMLARYQVKVAGHGRRASATGGETVQGVVTGEGVPGSAPSPVTRKRDRRNAALAGRE
jgi:CRP/FNR family transcriptional activator FtrB